MPTSVPSQMRGSYLKIKGIIIAAGRDADFRSSLLKDPKSALENVGVILTSMEYDGLVDVMQGTCESDLVRILESKPFNEVLALREAWNNCK